MKKITQHMPLTLLVTGMLFAGNALAQEVDNRANVYGGVSWFNLDTKRETYNDDGFVVGGEIPIGERWSATAEMWRNEADMIYVPGGETKNSYYRAGGNYHFNKIGVIQPYFAAGVGNIEHNPRYEGIEGGTGVDVGLGFKSHLGSSNLFLRGDAKLIVSEGNLTDFVAGLSVGYAFGSGGSSKPAEPARQPRGAQDSDGDGVFDSNDMCPNTPAGASVDSRGCELDSDRDGVVDSRDRCPNTDQTHAVDQHGCTIMDVTEVRQTLEVLFDVNKAAVKPEFNSELREFADFMNMHENSSATIEGHTDTDGAEEYNQRLSERRANAVLESLVSEHDIERNRLRAIGYGESRPVAPNTTEAGKAQNRRTEAVIESRVSRPRER